MSLSPVLARQPFVFPMLVTFDLIAAPSHHSSQINFLLVVELHELIPVMRAQIQEPPSFLDVSKKTMLGKETDGQCTYVRLFVSFGSFRTSRRIMRNSDY
jgi:hypothetical protein